MEVPKLTNGSFVFLLFSVHSCERRNVRIITANEYSCSAIDLSCWLNIRRQRFHAWSTSENEISMSTKFVHQAFHLISSQSVERRTYWRRCWWCLLKRTFTRNDDNKFNNYESIYNYCNCNSTTPCSGTTE